MDDLFDFLSFNARVRADKVRRVGRRGTSPTGNHDDEEGECDDGSSDSSGFLPELRASGKKKE